MAQLDKKNGILRGFSIKILSLLTEHEAGLTIRDIESKLGIPRRTIYNHLKRLNEQKLVINVYPIWKMAQLAQSLGGYQKMAQLCQKDKIQLHNISFVLRLLNKPEWWEKRRNRLIRLKEYHFREEWLGRNPYYQLMKDDYLIQIFSNSIIFISKKKYYGIDSYDCFIEAMGVFLEELSYLEKSLNYTFFRDTIPQIKVRSQHYVSLRDALAEKCKKEGKFFEININGKRRLWVDMSEPLGVEAGHKDYAPEDMNIYRNHIQDIIEKNPPQISDMANMLMGLMETLNQISEHNKETAIGLKAITHYISSTLKKDEQEQDPKEKPDYFG